MKKILLILMLMISSSFAFNILQEENGYLTHVVDGKKYCYSKGSSSKVATEVDVDGIDNIHYNFYDFSYTPYRALDVGRSSFVMYFVWLSFTPAVPNMQASRNYFDKYQVDVTSVDCNSISPLPNDSPFCDPYLKRYATTSGQCIDCSQSDNVNAVAACACDAVGSSYTGLKVDIVETDKKNGYSFTKTTTKCDNGVSFPVYTNMQAIPPTTPDNNTSTPTDNNSTTPTTPDNNTTTPTNPDNNTTTPTTPSNEEVLNALKSIENGQKDSTTALKDVGVDVKAINAELAKQGTTFNEILSKITEGNAKADSRFKLMDDEYKGQQQYRNMMGKWVDDDLKNASSQLSATKGVESAVNGTTNAVHGTTSAVNTQGKAITDKLGEILDAIKDSNGSGTDMGQTNDLLEKIQGDTNSTVSKLDTLHDDFNKTNSLLDDLKGYFDNNDSFKTPDVNESAFELSDLLPENSWFETNKLNLKFNGYNGACYCETAQFQIAGKSFVFPPPELLEMIPFSVVSGLIMAFVYLLGLKEFLKD